MFEIKSRFTSKVIFRSEKATTIKEAVEEAIDGYANLSGADLRRADLSYADLSGADLRDANLCDADLSYADLSYADLSYAYLSGADLRDADLRGAYLRGANLSDADLRGADLRGMGNKKELRTMQIDTYEIGFTKDTLQIGCKRFSIDEWKNFDDDKISKMDSNSLVWWKKWKDFIFKAIKLSFEEN